MFLKKDHQQKINRELKTKQNQGGKKKNVKMFENNVSKNMSIVLESRRERCVKVLILQIEITTLALAN